MTGNKSTFFFRSIKGKIIVASILACFTLLLAWSTSKVAFKHMLSAVENISAPNEKLQLVNKLTRDVTRLDQVQKSEMLNNPANYYRFFKETKKLLVSIDTLQKLFAGDNSQIKRIKSLKNLLIDRDKLFINYLKTREGLVNNKTFTSQVKRLNELVNKIAQQSDSTVTTTEKKTTTTTVVPERKDSVKQSGGFFNKLFGKRKKYASASSYKVVDEELNVKHDTLAKAARDSILKGMGETMHKLEINQLRRSALFVNKEAILNRANTKLIRRILTILREVEAQALTQTALNNNDAKTVVNTSVRRINYIILVFFLISVILVYFILTDISRIAKYRNELEIARDEAEYHGQAKHRFLSNMSHEIRTPLQSIIGYAGLIKQQNDPDKKYIDAIYQSSEHLMQIVNEVLDYNRIISGKFIFNNQPFNMDDLLAEVMAVMRFQAEKKSIELTPDYQIPATDIVEGDAFRLKQILYNILGNAIKFTDSGEVKLSISYTCIDDLVQYSFTVSDTGIGLSKKDLSRIFTEFEQAQNPGYNNTNGTGLGLTISKALIEAQGGSITVMSELGIGSSFIFDLGYKIANERAAHGEKDVATQIKTTHDKVWIVDDDNFILDLCSNIFETNGIVHSCFSSPTDALNAPYDPAVKYILLDMRMPEMSGAELCNLLRKKVTADVLIFALTAQVLPDEQENVLKQGFDGVLAKPFRERELLALVTRSVENPEDDQPTINLDISKIEKMTFGDKQQVNNILKRFTEDSINDIAELKLSVGNYNDDKALLLLHRIAGRTAQVGASGLSADFRLAEASFLKSPQDDKEIIVEQLTTKLQALVTQVNTAYLDIDLPEPIM